MLFLILILIVIFNSTLGIVYASEPTTYYARIMQDNVYLYKQPIDVENVNNIYFKLPRTYFVELINSANTQYYEVNYSSIKGYVKKDAVQAILGKPSTPYLTDIHFRVFAELSRDMREQPNTSQSSDGQIIYLPSLTKNLTYYGEIEGETLIDGRTNIWYYCKYSADKDYFGYVYSDFCDQLSPITLNTEEVTYTNSPTFEKEIDQPTSLPVENKTTGLIIVVLSIPAIICVYLFVKGSNVHQSKQKKKEVIEYSQPGE